jgi:amino acid adenylation domain-containing protein
MSDAAQARPATRAARDRGPASYAQRGLWFLWQLDPDSAEYVVPVALHLRGPLRRPELERALGEVVRKHEALRTNLVESDGEPRQMVRADETTSIPLTDLSAGTPTEMRLRLRAEMAEASARPFDLAEDDLLRAHLWRLGDDEHVLLICMHHSVTDGWSLEVLGRDLAGAYSAAAIGGPPLDDLPLQYADYARWQRQWLEGSRLDHQLSYWRTRLASLPPLRLPADRPPPEEPTAAGRLHRFRLPADLLTSLRELGEREGCTLFMVVLAAFQALLARWSGQDDVAVGTAIANRGRPELGSLIGLFVNMVVLRGDLSGSPTFRDLLRRTRGRALEAYAHQDVPFERVVEVLEPARGLGRTPLFQAAIVMDDAGQRWPALGDVEVRRVPVEQSTSRFDLTLFLSPSAGGLACQLEYRTALFEPATVERLGDHLRSLLAMVADDPERRPNQVRLSTAEEMRARVASFNQAWAGDSDGGGLHQLFEAQADRSPHATALVEGDTHLSYAELERQANRLAHLLQGRGVGPESRVGVCIPRSADVVVSVLAVLKAGGAYVPMDPGHPRERLAHVVRDAALQALVTESSILADLPRPLPDTICLDRDRQLLDALPGGRPPSPARPDNLAYVIYTSGSTGVPKGVAMPHRPIRRLIEWQARTSLAGAGDRTLQFTTLGFDVATQEILATLATGGQLVMLTERERADLDRLAELLAERRVNRLFLPFVALRHLAQSCAANEAWPAALREVITAGEQLQVTMPLRALFRQVSGCSLENQYGPTESHVVTAHRLVGPPQEWPPLPLIGRPVDGARIGILDDDLRDVPIGTPGQLCIGGGSLARGYLGRPGLTAARFVPDPYSGEPGGRLYLTGDRARFDIDGGIEYLGRLDHQMKIRGHRVEAGEVEAALGAHPGVAGAAVAARDMPDGGRRLVAYIVPRDQPTGRLSLDDLRGFLAARLPEVMIPSLFVPLERLPMTPTGKVDRRALPGHTDSALSPATPYRAPRTLEEQAIVRIWERVMKRSEVGVDESFFELGGESLLAMRMLSEVRAELGADIPLESFFDGPTVARLAVMVGATGN